MEKIVDGDHVLGDKKASVVLVEYGDYQCPYCAAAHPVVQKLEKYFRDQMVFVYRNYPLVNLHKYAEAAAETAEFADEFGKFWEMHNFIFENQDELSISFLYKATEDLGLPVEKLDDVLDNHLFMAKIQNDVARGNKSGVKGTPTFFINGGMYHGPVDFKTMIHAIESVFAK